MTHGGHGLGCGATAGSDMDCHLVERRVGHYPFQGLGGAVQATHFAGAEGGGLYAPTTDITVHVEHGFTGHPGPEAGAGHPVIVEPAGFLAAVDRGKEVHTVFPQG